MKLSADLFFKRSMKTVGAPFSRGWAKARQTRKNDVAQVLILAYHRVVASIAEAERNSIYGLVISTESFARHLEIVRSSYDILSLDEALLALRGGRSLDRPAAVITFDDGYRDVYDNAWPVLRQMGLPATVYVPTALMGSGQILDHDRLYWLSLQARAAGIDLRQPLHNAGITPQQSARILSARHMAQVADALNYHPLPMRQAILRCLEAALPEAASHYPASYELMSWEMIREMADGGISFGAHSDRHLILTLEDGATSEQEIHRSKQVLEAQLRRPVWHFAYPNGYCNPLIQAMVRRAGFASAVTTKRSIAQRGDDVMTLPRISLCEESTRGITGTYSEAVAHLRLAA
ncbi:MAG: polysaccharide deacetylase family protein [Acidobacteria bacterium]|nr:polysaccharide deacetylase family protein [Acidobacteriota bacterium]